MDLPPLGLGARPAVVDCIASWDVQWHDDFYLLRPDEEANRDGVRDIDHALDAEADVLRIAFLGDGVTFGFWFSQAESHPALFEKLARERGLRIEVFDIALPG